MDHFNATVFNGSIVATRRGFQVTKQKYRGTAFVHSSVQDAEQHESTPKPAYSLPIYNTQLTFVTNREDEKKLAPRKRRTRRSKSPSNKLDNTGVVESKTLTRASRIRRQSSCSLLSTSSEGHQIREILELSDSKLSTFHELRSLPPWACYKLQPGLPDSTKRLLFMCLAFAPSDGRCDGYEGLEPSVDSPERDVWQVQDPTSLHCAIALGALFDAMRSGKRDSPDLASLTSQLSFIINRRLNYKTQDDSVHNITIHAVATLAILAGYLGKHDHWHVHMNGLLRLVDMAGGQDNLNIRTIATIRKAGFVGAISAATKPCIPFMRRRAPLQDSEDTLRPTLIWICLAGDMLATLSSIPPAANLTSFGRSPIYQELLRQVLGPQTSANPDLVSEADLQVCKLLDLGCLTGQEWDGRQAIKHCLGVFIPHAWL